MKQLTFVRKGQLQWWDVPAPVLERPTDALVRPLAVARCDLETAFFRHGLTPLLRLGVAAHLLAPSLVEAFGQRPFGGPFAVGHECVAEVLAVGSAVTEPQVGDLVVVPYQISCGGCGYCGAGITSQCVTDRAGLVSAFGGFADPQRQWGGALSDVLRVPFAQHLLVPLPPGVDPVAVASAGDNIVDGYRAVARGLRQWPGAPVLVVGGRARSVGLYAAALAVALGSSEVVYVDDNVERLQCAQSVGASAVHMSPARFRRATHLHRRFPLSVEASGRGSGLDLAMSALSPAGTCTVVALHWRASTPVPLWDMYVRNLSLETGLVNARALLPEVLALVRKGHFKPQQITSVVADWADAPQALLLPTTKVVIRRERSVGANC